MNSAVFILIALISAMLAISIMLLYLGAKTRQREQVSRKLETALHKHTAIDTGTEPVATAEFKPAKPYWSIMASLPMAAEIKSSLREAGYVGVQAQLVFAFINLALPIGVLVLSLVIIGFTGAQAPQLLATFIFTVLAFLLPRWLLRWLAARRRRALSQEIPVVIQLLLMLMGAGLSIEHALRILRAESSEDSEFPLLPEFSRELNVVLHRVDAGGSLAQELGLLSGAVGVQELSDLTAVLRQVLRRGGDIRQSLTNLAQLIEDRRYTRLQEQAGEISGKMSVVMILFMFPALVLFIAGPGFLAVLEGLRDVSS